MPKPELENTWKSKLNQIKSLTIENFAKKDAFWANSHKPEKLKLEKFWNFETWKTRTPKRQLNSYPKKSKFNQALHYTIIYLLFMLPDMYLKSTCRKTFRYKGCPRSEKQIAKAFFGVQKQLRGSLFRGWGLKGQREKRSGGLATNV